MSPIRMRLTVAGVNLRSRLLLLPKNRTRTRQTLPKQLQQARQLKPRRRLLSSQKIRRQLLPRMTFSISLRRSYSAGAMRLALDMSTVEETTGFLCKPCCFVLCSQLTYPGLDDYDKNNQSSRIPVCEHTWCNE